MTDEPDPIDTEYELIMPFIVCQSNGGPYDDDSFVAGWELGKLDVELPTHAALGYQSLSRLAHAGTVPQVELLAMKHGFRVRHVSDDQDGWVNIDLERIEDGAE